MSVLEHHLIVILGGGSFLGMTLLILVAGAWLLDRHHEKKQEKAVAKTSPSLVSLLASLTRKRINKPIKKRFKKIRKKRQARHTAIRPAELWEKPPAVAIAASHRCIRYRNDRLILSDYEDCTTSAYVVSGRSRYRLDSVETCSRSDDDWRKLLKDGQWKDSPVSKPRCAVRRPDYSPLPHLIDMSPANRRLWVAGAFSHLTDKHVLTERRYTRSQSRAA